MSGKNNYPRIHPSVASGEETQLGRNLTAPSPSAHMGFQVLTDAQACIRYPRASPSPLFGPCYNSTFWFVPTSPLSFPLSPLFQQMSSVFS